ncbi:diguanylate cyclase [bacterium]|nr:diguanylate cyclase [bacterium]
MSDKRRDLIDKFAYLLLALTIFLFVVLVVNNPVLSGFFEDIENKSFDYRQTLLVKSRHLNPSKDIVIITIDDASYEYILNKYGEWPVPRKIYADMLNFLEKQNPRAVIFDLMFINSKNSTTLNDNFLTSELNKYDNVYAAINFDNQLPDVRKPEDLPDRISVNVDNNSQNVDIKGKMSFLNCRSILDKLMTGRVNVGMVNVKRSNDGIIRQVPTFVCYKDKYYPYLSLKAGADILSNNDIKDFVIDKKSDLIIADKKIPLTNSGEAILNWYGSARSTYQNVPFYKVLEDMKQNVSGFDYKDKIIYVGTTAVSLYDAKSVPVDRVYPGVEIHATYLNNMLDNSFIKKSGPAMNTAIITLIILLISLIVIKSNSVVLSSILVLFSGIVYYLITYYSMKCCNYWVILVLPLIVMVFTFAISYLAKYLIKSRDFEHQYKLATTDGLTELYNHRYFQDMMKQQIEQSKRYNSKFSLIMIDIDYFKQFNDKYGHQAGDAVLKQVAQILKRNTRVSDYVCRYGGEEMAIILPNTGIEETLKNAERIRKAVEETPFKLSLNQEGQVTISLGISSYNGDEETAQDIIKRADNALYKAKENGRNQVVS